MPLDFPLNNQEKGSIESANFAELKARQFKGGLPVFTSVPTYVGSYGEMVLYCSDSTYQLYSYLNEGWRNVGSGSISSFNLVDDTTPQLGGDLDMNGKGIDFPTTANITDVLDEDTMASNSATKLATQQSIKAYVDGKLTGISNVVEDTTPQLGGDLDLNGKNIDFPTTPNISDVLDEDNMASNSATKLATQQSIKAYVDANATAEYKYVGTGGLTTKLYYNFALDFGDSDMGSTDDIFIDSGVAPDIYASGMRINPTGAWTIITTNGIFIGDWGGASQDGKVIIVEFAAIFNGGTAGEQSAVGLTTGLNTLTDYDDQTADAVSISLNGGDVYGHTSNAGVGHTETGLSGSLTITNMNLYRIEFDPGVSAKFYVNGTLRATITTNLPDGAGGLKFGLGGTTDRNGIDFITKPVFSIEI
jgi:hypothetical protein